MVSLSFWTRGQTAVGSQVVMSSLQMHQWLSCALRVSNIQTPCHPSSRPFLTWLLQVSLTSSTSVSFMPFQPFTPLSVFKAPGHPPLHPQAHFLPRVFAHDPFLCLGNSFPRSPRAGTSSDLHWNASFSERPVPLLCPEMVLYPSSHSWSQHSVILSYMILTTIWSPLICLLIYHCCPFTLDGKYKDSDCIDRVHHSNLHILRQFLTYSWYSDICWGDECLPKLWAF